MKTLYISTRTYKRNFMIESLDPSVKIDLRFDRKNLQKLGKYFNFNFVNSSLDEKTIFFKNLYTVCRQSLGLAHSIQHHATAVISVQLSNCQPAKDRILSKEFGELIGCITATKRSDSISLIGNVLNGHKKWITNLDTADFAIIQIEKDSKPHIVYVDLHHVLHKIDYSFFTPFGMEIARPGSLIFDQQTIDPACVLGVRGTQDFFQQSNFGSFCFLTNHYAVTKQLFLDIKKYAIDNNCGADFDIKKLEIDVATLQMMWTESLPSLEEKVLSHEFWNKRNTQYAFSKKTLLSVIQLVLELGNSYYMDAHSESSQRFRDALTYSSHMYSLCRFGQEFHMIDIAT